MKLIQPQCFEGLNCSNFKFSKTGPNSIFKLSKYTIKSRGQAHGLNMVERRLI